MFVLAQVISHDHLKVLLQRLGELYRKLWNYGNFKAHVSPHEMLQAIVLCSKKVFQITKQGDAIDVLSWLLNSLHIALNGTKNLKSSVISRTLRGKMKVSSRKLIPAEVTNPEELTKLYNDPEYYEKSEEQQFTYLTLDVPPMPLFKVSVSLVALIRLKKRMEMFTPPPPPPRGQQTSYFVCSFRRAKNKLLLVFALTMVQEMGLSIIPQSLY